MNAKEKERADAIASLREVLKPGDTVYCNMRHVSRSGMSRVIQLYALINNEPRYLGFNAALATGHRYDREREGVRIGGCGMDMGFALVYDLSHALYPEYRCLGKKRRCPSPDHSNAARLGESVPRKHRDGYALSHRWL